MTNYKIDAVIDTVCPWCYVGKKRLEIAIKQHQVNNPSDSFSITWHAFQLNPTAPKESIPKQQHMARKFGTERTKTMFAYMSNLGRQIGIDFSFNGMTGNSRDSHRLVQLGRTKGEAMQNRVMDQLLNAYFEADEDITDRNVLLARGVKAGLSESETREWLESGKGGAEVDEDLAQARQKYISGVPNFTINDQYEVHGAEEPSTFLKVFNQIKAASSS